MARLRMMGGHRRAFRAATRASTTRSAPRIRRPRSPRRSAWRSRRKLEGREAPRRRGDRRRRDERRHGVRGAEQRRRDGRRPAGDPQRQRHVDLASRSARSTTISRGCCRRASTTRAPRRQGSAVAAAAGAASSRERAEEHVKGMVLPGTLFEEFGFNYIGPIDGHDLDALVPTLANIKQAEGPAVPARRHAQGPGLQARRGRSDPLSRRHGKFDPADGIVPKAAAASRPTRRSSATGCATWPRAIRGWSASRRRCAKARAWCGSRSEFPERYFDVGIAEQHAVTFAAGLACEGMKPVVAIYSTFLQRALRPADPRRRAAEPAGAVRDRSRRARRRRRRDAHRRVRSRLPALPAEHDGDGAVRRERMPADAVHRLSRSTAPAAVRYPRGSRPGRRRSTRR